MVRQWVRAGLEFVVGAGILGATLGIGGCTRAEQSTESVAETANAISIGPVLSGEETEADDQFIFDYVFRRRFPFSEISRDQRYEAVGAIGTLRASTGIDEYDFASDTCSGTCPAPGACLAGFCAQQCQVPPNDCPSGTVARLSNAHCYCVPPSSVGTPLPASGCGWTPIGPNNVPGRVNALAFDPKNPNRLFAGTVGGLWSSSDKGRRWGRVVLTPPGMPAPASARVRSLDFNPTSGELFVGTGDEHFGGDGVWLSSTGVSGSFSKISGATFDNAVIARIKSVPANGGSVYVASEKGVYVGVRSGAAWSWSVLAGMASNVTDLAADFRTSPPTLFAGVVDNDPAASRRSGVYRFNTVDWDTPGLSFPNSVGVQAVSVGLATINPNIVYARVVDNNVATVYKSTNSGIGAWTTLPSTTIFHGTPGRVDANRGGYNAVLEVDPNDPNTVVIGGIGVYSSSDGGANFEWLSQRSAPFVHPDVHAVAFEPTTSFGSKHMLYVGTDGGVFVSDDMTKPNWAWYERSHGMQTAEFYRISAQSGVASVFGGGLQDNGTMITAGARNWLGPNDCDGSLIGFDASNASIYEQCNATPFQVFNRSYFSSPAPQSFAALDVDPAAGADMGSGSIGLSIRLVTDPTISRTAIAQGTDKADTTKQVLLKTTDARIWKRLSLSLPSDRQITALAIAPGTGSQKTYVVATQDLIGSEPQASVYVSHDSGASFGAATFLPTAWITGIAIDPGNASRPNPQRIWVASAGGVLLESDDNGASWNPPIGIPLPQAVAVTGLAVDGTGNGALFLATDAGVLRGDIAGDGSIGFKPYSNGLPDGVDVNDIAFNPQTSSLVIGTFGNGAYRIDPSETNCADTKLIVRDTAYDYGQSPSPSGLPDPEWLVPIDPDPVPPGQTPPPPFYKPDDRNGERVYFFESPDVRINIPSERDPAKYMCPLSLQPCQVDSVSFDEYPIQYLVNSPEPHLFDVQPRAGVPATVHVQVGNVGVARAGNVRVVAMYADASAGVPLLSTSFFSSTVVPGGNCAALQTPDQDLGNTWHLVGCKTLGSDVAPGVPEIAHLDWTPPDTTKMHSCMVVMVDSPTDNLPASLRSMTNVEQLAQLDRHVAQRNLQVVQKTPLAAAVVPAPNPGELDAVQVPGVAYSGVETLNVPNRWNPSGPAKVLFAKGHLGSSGTFAFMLPTGKTAPGLPPACGVATNSPSNVAIALPKGIVTSDVALAANGTIDIADRGVTVLTADGAGGPIVNAGTGMTTVGVSARVGTISAIGGVFLRSAATVLGDVNVDGSYNKQTGVTIQGNVVQGAPLTPADAIGWSVIWPTTSLGNVDLLSGAVSKPPGRYGSVSVKSGAVLTFGAGTYYLDSLTLESGSTLELNQAAGFTVIYTRQGVTIRGTVRGAQNAPTDLLLVALGTAPVNVESSLAGSIVAPSAPLTLGNNGGTYAGAYYAHDLTIRPDVHVQLKTSAAWPSIPMCRALTASEKTAVTALGLSPTLYPALGDEPTQSLPIPSGQVWRLGARYDVGHGLTGSASRFRVLSLDPQDRVVAGSTYLLQH